MLTLNRIRFGRYALDHSWFLKYAVEYTVGKKIKKRNKRKAFADFLQCDQNPFQNYARERAAGFSSRAGRFGAENVL